MLAGSGIGILLSLLQRDLGTGEVPNTNRNRFSEIVCGRKTNSNTDTNLFLGETISNEIRH
jgi:hypothetical protein